MICIGNANIVGSKSKTTSKLITYTHFNTVNTLVVTNADGVFVINTDEATYCYNDIVNTVFIDDDVIEFN